MRKSHETAWRHAFEKGSKAMQSRLQAIHAKNPEFQDFVKKHGFGGTLSKKQAEKQKSSSVVSVKPVTKIDPEMKKGPKDREALIRQAAEKIKNRRQANANRVAFGGELGGGFVLPNSGFRRYSEEWSVEPNERRGKDRAMDQYHEVKHGKKTIGDVHKEDGAWTVLHYPTDKESYGHKSKPQAVAHLKRLHRKYAGIKEAVKRDKLGFPITKKDDPALPPPKTPHSVPPGYERVKDRWGFNMLRKVQPKITKEDVAYLDGALAMYKGGWVARRNGKQLGPVVSSKELAQQYIKNTKKKLGAKFMDRLVRMKPKLATESRANRERVASWDSAVIIKKSKLNSLTVDPKSRLNKLRQRIGVKGLDKLRKILATESAEMSNKENINEVSRNTIAKLATARYRQAQAALKNKNYPEYVKKMQKAMKAGDSTVPKTGWTPEDDDPPKIEEVSPFVSLVKHIYEGKRNATQLYEQNTESHPELWNSHMLKHEAGHELKKGDKVKGFRGTYKIKGFEMPHHEGSTGRVYTDKGTFFPGVVNAKIVKRKNVSEEGVIGNNGQCGGSEGVPAPTYRDIREAKVRKAISKKED